MKTLHIPSEQTGAALLISLILLVVLTLLGLSAMDTVTLETKLATNAQEKSYAFQMAETVLRENDDELFGDTNFVSRLTVQDDREIRAEEADWVDKDGDGTADPPADVVRNAKLGMNSEADPDKTLIEYKGSFLVPTGAPGGDWDVNVAAGAYFEVLTQARNVQQSLAGAAGEIMMTVRAGYRQLAPADSNIVTSNVHFD